MAPHSVSACTTFPRASASRTSGRFCRPLKITIDELDEGIAILEKALAVADEVVE
jgi:hypothetical protein